MRHPRVRLAAAIGLTICALTAAPAVTAAARSVPVPPTVGDFKVTAPAMPHSAWLKGRALTFTMDVSQTSRYHVAIQLYFSMWARTNPGFQQTRGVTVRWLNPENGLWQKPYSAETNGTYYLGPQDLGLRIATNQVVRIPVRIWFGSLARPGTYYISPGVSGYAVFNGAGQSFPAILGDIPADGYTYTVHVYR